MTTVLLALLACSDHTYTQLEQKDVFIQNPLNTVDLLLVVDNSCSMIEEQGNLAPNFDRFISVFEGANVNWQIGVTTTDVYDPAQSGHLIGGDDEIVLWNADGREVDRVEYTWDWPIAAGTVFSLDMTYAYTTGNDSLDHWCVDVAASPGADNGDCDTQAAALDPTRGAVIVSEFVPDPDVQPDDAGEWVELTNISDADVDLSGYTLGDDGTNAFEIPDGTLIAAGGTLVFGRSDVVDGVDIVVSTDFTLNNHVLVLDRETEGAAEIFAEIVAQGISGSGLEQGLEAARRAVTEPLVSTANVGFLRPEANLSIVIVSDEEDTSPYSVDDYLRAYADVKGDRAYRDHQFMNVSAVVGDDPPEFDGQASCESQNGVADYGHRYVDAVSKTGGLLESICAEDFAPIVENLGLTLSGLLAEFELSRRPKLETLEVGIYADASDDSKVRDLTIDVDFTYDDETNKIRFEGPNVPAGEQYILATYKIQSGT